MGARLGHRGDGLEAAGAGGLGAPAALTGAKSPALHAVPPPIEGMGSFPRAFAVVA
jgi:hypothetical protein